MTQLATDWTVAATGTRPPPPSAVPVVAPPSASPDADLCLAPLANDRVVALACADADDGQRWAHNAFGDGTLINQLSPMQCLDVDGAGRPVLAGCTDPPQSTQRWVLERTGIVGNTGTTGSAVLALALDGRCVAATKATSHTSAAARAQVW